MLFLCESHEPSAETTERAQETHLIAPQGQRFIKEKFGSIVVDVAKREWPQNWPALIEQLCRIATIGELHAEMMLIVTRGLMEVVHGEHDMPSQRKARHAAEREKERETAHTWRVYVLTLHEWCSTTTAKASTCAPRRSLAASSSCARSSSASTRRRLRPRREPSWPSRPSCRSPS